MSKPDFVIVIKGYGAVLPANAEQLEDDLARFLDEQGLGMTGFIEDSITGNTTVFPLVPDPEDEEETVTCSICGEQTPAASAHLHQDSWVGEECWDERLRSSE